MFSGLDLWLIDKVFDPLYARLHRSFNIGNYTIAKWFLMPGSGLLVAAIVFHTISSDGPRILSIIAMFFELVCSMAAMRTAFRMEDQYRQPGAVTLPPNFRDGENNTVGMRRLFLTIVLVVIPMKLLEVLTRGWEHVWKEHLMDGFGLEYAGWIPTLIGLYFLACIPRRPREKTSPALVPAEA